jgi:hypothetical protein
MWTADGKREFAKQSVNFAVAPDAVHKVRLFIAAPPEGEERTEFRITTRARSGDERGDSDTVIFERPETEE